MIPDYVTLAEAIITRDETGWELDIEDYSWIVLEYEVENIPKTIFINEVEKNEL